MKVTDLEGRPVYRGEGRPMYRLENRPVLVTGAASGMGRATCLRLAEEGARVCAVDIDAMGLAETVEQIVAAGGAAAALPADIGDEQAVRDTVAEAVDTFGRLRGVVAAAGVLLASDRRHRLEDLAVEDFAAVLRVNLIGTFLTLKHTLAHLSAGGGSAVIIGSTAALIGNADAAAYTASKGGVLALTRLVAAQYGPFGVRANCICPGGVDTPMLESAVPDPAIRAQLGTNPLGRLGRPEEIAATAAHLLSDDASFVTGATIVVDGGATID